MRYRLWICLFILICLGGIFYQYRGESYYFIPFDEAHIQDSHSPTDRIDFYQRLDKKKWKLLARLYKSHIQGRQKQKQKERIPKIIHQICLGKTLSEKQKILSHGWIIHHPDWEYHLWTEEELCYLFLQDQHFIEQIHTIEDLTHFLAVEILYQFGGVFIAKDMQCEQPLDILHEKCTFFAGITSTIQAPEISPAIIGSTPGHPILKKVLRDHLTGDGFLSHAFFDVIKKREGQSVVILPSTFFYPEGKPENYSFASLVNIDALE